MTSLAGVSLGDLMFMSGGAFAAAALSGSAGFGGALLLLPLLTRAVGPERAVPLLTLAQIVGNAARMTLGFSKIRWGLVGVFLCAGIPGAVLGALCFTSIPKAAIVRLMGGAILAFTLMHRSQRLRFAVGPRTLATVGAGSGFLSGLVGSAGPLGSAVFLSLNLPPVAYVASDGAASLLIHLAKTATYQKKSALPADVWSLALLLGLAMILGTWTSRRLIERLDPERFRRYVAVILGFVACKMMILG